MFQNPPSFVGLIFWRNETVSLVLNEKGEYLLSVHSLSVEELRSVFKCQPALVFTPNDYKSLGCLPAVAATWDSIWVIKGKLKDDWIQWKESGKAAIHPVGHTKKQLYNNPSPHKHQELQVLSGDKNLLSWWGKKKHSLKSKKRRGEVFFQESHW